MMPEFYCPHCNARLRYPLSMAGKTTPCAKCGRALTVPALPGAFDPESAAASPDRPSGPPRPAPSQPPPIEDFAPSDASTSKLDRPRRNAARRRFRKLSALLDWKFQRYLTPWIIRFTWIVALAWTVVAGLLLVYAIASSLLPQRPDRAAVPSFDLSGSGDLGQLLNSPALSSLDLRPAWMRDPVYRIAMYAAMLTLVVLWTLWTRVLLECIIVIFNIAETARSIDKRLEHGMRAIERHRED